MNVSFIPLLLNPMMMQIGRGRFKQYFELTNLNLGKTKIVKLYIKTIADEIDHIH
jgi:hypothetical protein